MECKWRPQARSGVQKRQAATTEIRDQSLEQSLSPTTDTSPGTSVFQSGHAVDEVFDYASFMWDYGDFWQQPSPGVHQNQGLESNMLVSFRPGVITVKCLLILRRRFNHRLHSRTGQLSQHRFRRLH